MGHLLMDNMNGIFRTSENGAPATIFTVGGWDALDVRRSLNICQNQKHAIHLRINERAITFIFLIWTQLGMWNVRAVAFIGGIIIDGGCSKEINRWNMMAMSIAARWCMCLLVPIVAISNGNVWINQKAIKRRPGRTQKISCSYCLFAIYLILWIE